MGQVADFSGHRRLHPAVSISETHLISSNSSSCVRRAPPAGLEAPTTRFIHSMFFWHARHHTRHFVRRVAARVGQHVALRAGARRGTDSAAGGADIGTRRAGSSRDAPASRGTRWIDWAFSRGEGDCHAPPSCHSFSLGPMVPLPSMRAPCGSTTRGPALRSVVHPPDWRRLWHGTQIALGQPARRASAARAAIFRRREAGAGIGCAPAWGRGDFRPGLLGIGIQAEETKNPKSKVGWTLIAMELCPRGEKRATLFTPFPDGSNLNNSAHFRWRQQLLGARPRAGGQVTLSRPLELFTAQAGSVMPQLARNWGGLVA